MAKPVCAYLSPPLTAIALTLVLLVSAPISRDGFAQSGQNVLPSADDIQRTLLLKRIGRLKERGARSEASALMPMLRDKDAQIRLQAEQAIWAMWGRSGNADLDRLFRSGVRLIGRNELDAAIETLSRVIDEAPRFAEAWNKRATARFLAGDLTGALDDCERTLQLVPDHFGSLSGYGHIYFRLDDLDQALLYWDRALAINPNLDAIARSIDAVRRLQASRGRLTT